MKNKPFFIFIAVIIVMILAVLAVYSYTMHLPLLNDQSSIETAKSTLTSIKNELQPVAKKYQIEALNITESKMINQFDNELGYFVPANGESLEVKANYPAQSDFDVSLIDDTTINIIDKYIADNGFTTYVTHDAHDGQYLKSFGNSKVMCTISELGIGDIKIDCSSMETLAKTSDDLKNFANLYFKTNPDISKTNTTVGEPAIKNLTNGYANATMSVGSIFGGGSVALFYHAPTGAWTYWRGTQSILACKEYNTAILRAAFRGDDCALPDDNGEMSTAKVGL